MSYLQKTTYAALFLQAVASLSMFAEDAYRLCQSLPDRDGSTLEDLPTMMAKAEATLQALKDKGTLVSEPFYVLGLFEWSCAGDAPYEDYLSVFVDDTAPESERTDAAYAALILSILYDRDGEETAVSRFELTQIIRQPQSFIGTAIIKEAQKPVSQVVKAIEAPTRDSAERLFEQYLDTLRKAADPTDTWTCEHKVSRYAYLQETKLK